MIGVSAARRSAASRCRWTPAASAFRRAVSTRSRSSACGFCLATFGLYAFLLNACRFRLTAFRFRAFPLDELGIRSPAFGFHALPLDPCGFRSTTFGLNALLLEARGFRLSLFCFYAFPLDSCGLRFAALGLGALPLDACRFGFPSRGLRAFPLEPLALGAQFRKRAADQVVCRTKLFQAVERGFPSTGLDVPTSLLDGLARQAFVRDRRQREDSVENRFELRMFPGLLPGREIGRLEVFEFQRHLDGVDENRQQDLAPRRSPCLVSHPRGVDRSASTTGRSRTCRYPSSRSMMTS